MITACGCNTTNTVGNSPVCDRVNGVCECKSNYVGRTCNECQAEYYSSMSFNYSCERQNIISGEAIGQKRVSPTPSP